MAKKKLTEEQEKEIKLLQANNEMLEKTKEEARLRGNEKSVERIQLAQDDVIEQMKKIDPSSVENVKKKTKKTSKVEEMMLSHQDDDDVISVFDALKETEKESEKKEETKTVTLDVAYEESETTTELREERRFDYNNVDPEAQYDIVSLPSNGECYKGKCSRVPVAYLTANDENLITSPSLYKDGLVIDFLLKNKVMNSEIDVDELCSGDVDAIILFLRATSYGTDFPISAYDAKTKQNIESVVDLSTLKYKEFTLKADEDGLFDFECPLTKDKLKFRFLTRKDEKNLKLLSKIENDATKGLLIENSISDIKEAIVTDSSLNGGDKAKMYEIMETITNWADKLKESKKPRVSRTLTNRMEMNIVSVNGETDRKFIAKYVKNMNTRDALAFRRYVIQNEPGVDFSITVERPKNLGGGSFETFLEWNDFVFYNIV